MRRRGEALVEIPHGSPVHLCFNHVSGVRLAPGEGVDSIKSLSREKTKNESVKMVGLRHRFSQIVIKFYRPEIF